MVTTPSSDRNQVSSPVDRDSCSYGNFSCLRYTESSVDNLGGAHGEAAGRGPNF